MIQAEASDLEIKPGEKVQQYGTTLNKKLLQHDITRSDLTNCVASGLQNHVLNL